MLQSSLDHKIELLTIAIAPGEPNTDLLLSGDTEAEVVEVIIEKRYPHPEVRAEFIPLYPILYAELSKVNSYAKRLKAYQKFYKE